MAALTIVEVAGTTAAAHWARTGSGIAGVMTVVSFAWLGVLLACTIQAAGSRMNVVNAAWQSLSIVAVAMLATVAYDEEITSRQGLGVALAVAACVCFV